eukprot:548908_1
MIGRKRRFSDSDDSDSASPIIKSPKKKRRRTLQSSQSDDEHKTTNNKPMTKRKTKKTPNKVHRTPKPLTLTEAKMPTQSISPTSPHHAITPKNSVKTKQSTNTKSGTPKKKKKKKTPVKCHDIRNFFNVSATDYFSKCTNYKNLKKQTHAASKPSNKTKQQTKACKPRVDEAPKEMIDDSDDVDMTQEDIEMKHTSDTDDHDKQINHNKPLQRPHRSISY